MSTSTSEQDATAQTAAAAPPKWQFKDFPTVAAALSFAHANKLKAGELSATARNNGTVGMFYFD